MARILNRKYDLNVGGIEIRDLRINFRVKKSLKPEPNTLDLDIYNLSESRRSSLEAIEKTTVRLSAGYEETGVHQLFLGEARTSYTKVEGPGRITTLAAGDGEEQQQARIRLTFGAQIGADVALDAIINTLGVGRGNLDSALAKLRSKGVASIYPKGVSLVGNAWREAQEFARSAELEISIQDGQILILDRLKPLEGKAVLLSPETGLIGSPSRDSKGLVNAVALMIPELVPGVKVAFDSVAVKGGYRIESAEYQGDTHSTEWFAHLSCRKY